MHLQHQEANVHEHAHPNARQCPKIPLPFRKGGSEMLPAEQPAYLGDHHQHDSPQRLKPFPGRQAYFDKGISMGVAT